MDTRNKLVTIRMAEIDVNALDSIARDLIFYSRSDIINAAAKLILRPEFMPFIRDLVRSNLKWESKDGKLVLESKV